MVGATLATRMDAGFAAHLTVGDCAFDERDAALLRAVDRESSLNAAASALGRSYSRAHERIADLEAEAGPLVERRRGGAGGGGSELTDRARDLLARYDRLVTALHGTAATEAVTVVGDVVERDGDLATVETPAGRIRALVAGRGGDAERGGDATGGGGTGRSGGAGDAAPGTDADDPAPGTETGDAPSGRVRVTVRADAVTLHDPASAPDAGATSARNRFRGTVAGVERGDGTAVVAVDVGAATPLRVRVTEESLERLGLEPGAEVVAAFKATATYATSPGSGGPSPAHGGN